MDEFDLRKEIQRVQKAEQRGVISSREACERIVEITREYYAGKESEQGE